MNTHLLLVWLTTGLLFIAVYCVGEYSKSTRAARVANAPQVTCRMHAEVERHAPGTCPKCGMKLVEKVVSNEAGK
jgi:hypothetical protein